MLRLCMLAAVLASPAFAEGFTFNIASPVAAQDFRAKVATLVFRTQGCADPAKLQVGGSAEGLVKGTRHSLVLNIVPAGKPGVYAVHRNWQPEGSWVVNLKGTCSGLRAGAVVPIGPAGFLRESSKFFPRAATNAEIETALNALAQGGSR